MIAGSWLGLAAQQASSAESLGLTAVGARLHAGGDEQILQVKFSQDGDYAEINVFNVAIGRKDGFDREKVSE
ncbi:hypothetical protein V6N13_093087 [Hibiscus sabdariffa]